MSNSSNYTKDVVVFFDGLYKFIELIETNNRFKFYGSIKINENGWHYDQFDMDIQYIEPHFSKKYLELYVNGDILLSITEKFETFN